MVSFRTEKVDLSTKYILIVTVYKDNEVQIYMKVEENVDNYKDV